MSKSYAAISGGGSFTFLLALRTLAALGLGISPRRNFFPAG